SPRFQNRALQPGTSPVQFAYCRTACPLFHFLQPEKSGGRRTPTHHRAIGLHSEAAPPACGNGDHSEKVRWHGRPVPSHDGAIATEGQAVIMAASDGDHVI